MTFRREVAPGIEIRQVQPHDADTIFRSVEENRAYLRKWLPWVDPTQSAADVLEFIARTERQFADNLGPNAGIWVESRFCGTVGAVKSRAGASCASSNKPKIFNAASPVRWPRAPSNMIG